MALVRAMNSAISGLRSEQFRIDSIGDNLANATTTGFKSTRVEFKTLLSQTLSSGTAPQGFLGGVDPMQMGLGVTIGQTTKNFGQGELAVTGVNSDLGIDGSGFFIMKNAQGNQVFSRDGSFSLNPANLLHDASTGFIAQGINADLNTFTIASGAPVTNISVPIGNLTIAVATSNATFSGNLNGGGQQALMGSVLESQTLASKAGGGTPATAATLLTDLERNTGSGFVDLAITAGDTLTVNAVKGGRTLPTAKFFVGTSLPPGFDGFGTTLGNFASFVQRALGINTNGIQYGAIRTNSNNPNVPGIAQAATAVTTTTVRVTGVNFATAGVQPGDVVRFNTGAGAGQIATVATLTTTVTANDTINFTAPLASSIPLPGAGDQFTVHEPAAVSVDPTAAPPPPFLPNPGLTAGRLRVAGNVGTANGITSLQIQDQNNNLSFSPFTQIFAASGESLITNATFFDSNGGSHLVELTMVLETKGGVDALTGSIGNSWRFFGEAPDSKLIVGGAIQGLNRVVGQGDITFSTSGQFLSTSPLPSIADSIPNSGAQTPLTVNFDFTKMTGLADITSTAFLSKQDGIPTGTLSNFSIGSTGVITGIFSNGITRPIAQVILARFANPNGLTSLGSNQFQAAANSGPAIIAQPGQAGLGKVQSGVLESSNVDFAHEFTDLIVSQRSFQANTRVITATDELLKDLVNIV